MFSSITSAFQLLVVLLLSFAAFAWAAPPPAASTRTPRLSKAPSRPTNPAPRAGTPLSGDDSQPAEGALLESIENQNRLITDLIRTEVENELKSARSRMASDPAAVEQGLKLTIERVVRAPELNAEVRAQLRGQLEAALREANRRAATKEIIDQQVQEERAAAVDRLRIADALSRNQEKVRQLMDRFDSLMDEGRFLAAEESAAAEVEEVAPNLPVGVSATLTSRQTRNQIEALAARIARQKGVVNTLGTVEIAMIPFADDQPITYPDATVWEELTLRRKRFAAVDLKRVGPAEAKIRNALSDQTTMEFVETPLQDVVDYLKELHGIEIQLDHKALEEAGIASDAPVTRSLKGISLRSALRLLLGAMDLTYLIRDEVMLITTPDKAAAELSTRVYPVGDLVIPVISGFGGMMGGGMMGGGMMGGMGGGMMGGMGGGMGGGMMGGMGGGMGGMGGGMGGMGGGMF